MKLICKLFGHRWGPDSKGLGWMGLQAHPKGYTAIRFLQCSRCGVTRIQGRYDDPENEQRSH